MSLSDWFLLLGSLAGWATVFGSLVLYLHAGSTKSRDSMKTELLDKIHEQSEEMKEDHKVVLEQVSNLTKSLTHHYIRRDEFTQAIQGFNVSLTEVRRDMTEIRNQLFTVIKSNHNKP